MAVTCFLPCRSGSERVPRKNLRPFAGFSRGLIEIKLRQLLQARLVDRIVLSTDDEEILEYAASIGDSRLQLHRRDPSLASSATRTDELVGHVLDLIPEGHILWTHVTSPFFGASHYDQAIEQYFTALSGAHDSLMTVGEIRGFLWDQRGPLNYDRSIEKWPRTQTLDPVFEINSAAFIASAGIYSRLHDRIGERPFLQPVNAIEGFDIDWEDDFQIAQALLSSGVASI